MKLYHDGEIMLDTDAATSARPPWLPLLGRALLAMLLLLVGFYMGVDATNRVLDARSRTATAAAAVEPAGQAGADLDAACCPRFRAPLQADLDALLAAGGSLLVYVDEDGACASLSHGDGVPIRGYAGHPLDAARGCLEAWIAEGGAR